MGSRAVRGPKVLEARTEAMRVLRSNLLVALDGVEHPVVVLTSAKPREGKTTTCAALARSLARAGIRVVLVDLDLRRPDLHTLVQASDRVGAVDVLASHRSLGETVQFVPPAGGGMGFYFLAAGASVANPTELLEAAAAELLQSVASEADVVLVDTPPVLSVADTLVIARSAAGALLVVEAGRTSATDVRAAHDAFVRNRVRVLGIALNKLDAREVGIGYGEHDGASSVALHGADGAPWVPGWPGPSD